MLLLLILILLTITILIYKLLKVYNKNIIIIAICTSIIIYFILFPKECILWTISGTKMFFNGVFPSLFPFLIVCNILIEYDGIKIYSKLFGTLLCKPLRVPLQCSLTIIISALCGYPLGAKYCCELYEKRLINRATVERLLNIASNAGPIFVIGTVGTTMLNSKNGGYLLIISNYISCIVMSLLINPSNTTEFSDTLKQRIIDSGSKNIGSVLKNSIENAIKSTLSIGGYIVLFYVLIELLDKNYVLNFVIKEVCGNVLPTDVVKGSFLGLIEMTKGCKIISLLTIPINIKYAIVGFFLGFSGLSIISQVYSFTYIYPELSISKYIKRKLLQGFICSIITYILVTITIRTNSIAVFTNNSHNYNYYLALYLGIIFIIIPMLIYKLGKGNS